MARRSFKNDYEIAHSPIEIDFHTEQPCRAIVNTYRTYVLNVDVHTLFENKNNDVGLQTTAVGTHADYRYYCKRRLSRRLTRGFRQQ